MQQKDIENKHICMYHCIYIYIYIYICTFTQTFHSVECPVHTDDSMESDDSIQFGVQLIPQSSPRAADAK